MLLASITVSFSTHWRFLPSPRFISLLTLFIFPPLFHLKPYSWNFRSCASMAAQKLLVEYAKSSRSSCKICSKNIATGSLRLGFSTKDPRGFDMVRWHHLNCHPTNSHPLGAPEEIKGFSSLKGSDQDSLRKIAAKRSSTQSINGDNRKVIEESDEMTAKKRKLLGAENEKNLEVKFSLSDVKNKYKDADLPPNWKAFSTIIFNEREGGFHDTEKIAAFDFDGCLANTSVKRVGADAWSLMYPSIPEKLQGLYNGGHKLVIFTNESNIERWKNKRQQAVDSKIGRLDSFIKLVKVPIQVFIACGSGNTKMEIDDLFRKPKTGMWNIFTEHFNAGLAVDMNHSFYVGDAAGRANDHSDADIKFAQAIGLKFHVPEEFFLP